MRTLKLSPSLLEQYRVVRLGLYNKGPADLVEYITGAYVKSMPASRGSAYHELLEHGPKPEWKFWWVIDKKLDAGGRWVEGNKVSGMDAEKYANRLRGPYYNIKDRDNGKVWTFHANAARPAIELHENYSTMIHETWSDLIMESCGYRILMRLKTDGLDGLIIHEFKTTGRKKTYLDYYETIQWRCYMAALPEAQEIRYQVFQLNEKNTKCKSYGFRFLQEEANTRILQQEVDGLVGWLKSHPKLLERKIMTYDRNPLPI